MTHQYTRDATGAQYGGLTAIRLVGSAETFRGAIWLCRCKCGRELELPLKRLTSGRSWCGPDCPARQVRSGIAFHSQLKTRLDHLIYHIIAELERHDQLATCKTPRAYLDDERVERYQRILDWHVSRESRRFRQTWTEGESCYRRTGIPQCDQEDHVGWRPLETGWVGYNHKLTEDDDPSISDAT